MSKGKMKLWRRGRGHGMTIKDEHGVERKVNNRQVRNMMKGLDMKPVASTFLKAFVSRVIEKDVPVIYLVAPEQSPQEV